jgi:peroxiredoxin
MLGLQVRRCRRRAATAAEGLEVPIQSVLTEAGECASPAGDCLSRDLRRRGGRRDPSGTPTATRPAIPEKRAVINSPRRLLSLFGLSLLVLGASAAAAPQSAAPEKPAKAEIGKPAPDFTLKDTNGKSYTLSDFRGKNVVLEWINPDCPYCRRVMSTGVVANMLKELRSIDKDIVYFAINSTHYMSAEDTAKYLERNKIEAPGLVDQDGEVGRRYGARTTPHLFVIDRKGILRYNGAIDDDVRGTKGEKATNYVVNAVRQIENGQAVAPDTTRPYGCSVKYAKK